MLSEGRFPLARAAVPQAWRGFRVPALSLLSLPGDGVPGVVPSGEGCVWLVFRSGPDCAAGTSRRTFAASREQDRFPGRNTHGRSKRVTPPCGNREVAFLRSGGAAGRRAQASARRFGKLFL